MRRILVLSLLATASLMASEGYGSTEDSRKAIGAEISPTNAQTQQREGLTPYEGVQVVSVFGGTSAEKAGLQAGDVILAINGAPITSMSDMRNEVSMNNIGDSVALTIARNGDRVDLPTTVQAWPANIPYEPIDAAAEQRFRDWQDRRLAQAQDEARKLDKEAEALRQKLADKDSPEAQEKHRAESDEALLRGVPGAKPGDAWRLDYRTASDSGKVVTRTATTTTSDAATFPLNARYSLTTPDADQETL
jgi:membrane-associated protease RseP (regulator of RpoE activity)